MKKVLLRKIKFPNKEYQKIFRRTFPKHTYELLLLNEENWLQSRLHGPRYKLFIEAVGLGRLFIDESKIKNESELTKINGEL